MRTSHRHNDPSFQIAAESKKEEIQSLADALVDELTKHEDECLREMAKGESAELTFCFELVLHDAAAFIEFLSGRPDVAGDRFGVTGYCMGGNIALTVAGAFPGRFAAVASFHGGNLATESELSPHRLAPRIKGRVYVAGADQDKSYPPEMADRLEKALSDAGTDHRCEIYPGALHGWTMADFPVYDEAAAERHYTELFALLDRTVAG